MTSVLDAPTGVAPQVEPEFAERRKRRRIPVRRQLVNLSLITAAVVVPFVATGRAVMLLVIAAIGFFIMFHEFAHFAVAKMCGMKVTQFFVGFGPRLFSFRRGETEYGIKAIPAGGFVKIIGMNSMEEVDPEDERRAYRQATWPRRFAAIVAGPMSHFLVAFCLLIVMFSSTGDFAGRQPLIGSVATGSSAFEQGIRPGDRLVSVNGAAIETFDEAVGLFPKEVNVPIVLEVKSGDIVRSVTVSRRIVSTPEGDLPLIGIGVDPNAILWKTYPVGSSITKSFSTMGEYTTGTFSGMATFLRPSNIAKLGKQVAGASSAQGPITNEELESRPTSVVGMVTIGSAAAKRHPSELLQILVLINLALGAFNLLPMLPLDGGHIVIATYETIMSRIKGRRHFVDMNRVMPLAATFMAFILVLGLSAIYLDIVRPIS